MNITFTNAAGVLHQNWTVEEAQAAGIDQDTIDQAVTANRKANVSQECRRRIYAVASAETQMNMASASAVISSKTASSRSDAEKAVLDGLEAAIGWVAAMRTAAEALTGDPSKDLGKDQHWPEVPAAAAAVVGQF